MNGHESSQDDPFPFQFGTFEIANEPNTEVSDFQVVEHLSTLVIRHAIDHFRVHNNGVMGNHVRNELRDGVLLVNDRERFLLFDRNRGVSRANRGQGCSGIPMAPKESDSPHLETGFSVPHSCPFVVKPQWF
jgi:hypothetical protein